MSDLRVGELLHPAMTRTIAIFTGTASVLTERLQPAIDRTAATSQEAAKLIGAFLTPAAVLALVFGLWRLGLDLGWTANFPIARGLFSHWLVWIAAAIGLRMTSTLLNRPSPAVPEKDTPVSEDAD